MPSLSGSFIVPYSQFVPGSWQVMDWSQALVTVNKLPITNLQSIKTSRDLNIGSGTCTILISDPNKTQYALFQNGDEIEIFFATNTSPPLGRKVWGGYIDDLQFDTTTGQLLTISAKDYISRLQNQTYNGDFSTTAIATALQSIMATQADFTYVGITPMPSTLISANIQNDTMYNAIKQICDQGSAYFWIDPTTLDFVTRPTATIQYSPDSLYEETNILKGSQVQKNSEYLTNQVIVNYSGGTITVNDSQSQTLYGVYSRTVTVCNITTSAGATQYGNTLITSRNTPNESYQIDSLFLPYTDPGEFIPVVSPTLGLSGSYVVLTVGHSWDKNSGIKSSVTLNTLFADPTLYIADLQRRLLLVEQKSVV